MMKRLWQAVVLAGVLASPMAANAATITVSLGDFDGPTHVSGFPIDLGVIGTFGYAIPVGESIVAATFSGTYGTQEFSLSTAGFDAVIAGETIVVCVPEDPGCWLGGSSFRPFSFGLSSATFPTLAGGSVDLQIIQTNLSIVRLGSPTLTIHTRPTAVPEPAAALLLVPGLAFVGYRLRRRSS